MKEAMNEQTRDLNFSKNNWLNNVRNELNVMDLGFLWQNPGRMGIKKFKKVITKRMRDMELQNKRNNVRIMISGRLVYDMHKDVGIMKQLGNINNNDLRRMFIKICLNQFEDKIRREMGEKFCLKCGDFIEGNIGNHLILQCSAMTQERRGFEDQEWFTEATEYDPVCKQATKSLLVRFERPGIFELLLLKLLK